MSGKDNLKPFEKGGDPRRHIGRPKGAHNVSTVLAKMLKQVAPEAVIEKTFVRAYTKGKKRVTLADAVACRLLYEAIDEGSVPAIKEINDRTEGKAAQAVELSGPDGKELPATPQVVVYLPDNGRGDPADGE